MEARHLLDFLEREPDGYQQLLERNGYDLARTAYVLATARVSVYRGYIRPVPTPTELHVAAREICDRSQYLGHVPTRKALAALCVAEGLQVLPG